MSAPMPGEAVLPRLREDLQLRRGAPTITGAPTWLIFDPLQHKYLQIDLKSFQMLSVWPDCRTAQDMLTAMDAKFAIRIDPAGIARLAEFVTANCLSLEPGVGRDWREYARRNRKRTRSLATQAIHSYLFFRIPLVRPQKFLAATWPLVRPLTGRLAFIVYVLTSLAGLYLVSRQFDEFLATLGDFASLEGIAAFLLAIVFVKLLHELGHAYMCIRFGCRVPSMGIAFLVLMPVLFTDITDSWKLTSRRQRLLIASAGIIVELVIAGLATFLWAFLPPGTGRDLALVLATTSWALSLLVNLNPFMRFDGYYIASDAVGLPNLQPRSFAVGRWRLRELLFALGDEAPEVLPRRVLWFMSVYAWATWVYRLVLFLGIALLVYHMFFKALGVLLFVIEIGWFIGRPLAGELKYWLSRKGDIMKTARTYASIALLGLIVAGVAMPISGRVDIPVVVEPRDYVHLFPGVPARVEMARLAEGSLVRRGDILVELSSPELDRDIAQTVVEQRLVVARLERAAADAADRSQTQTLSRALERLHAKLAGLHEQREELRIRAPIAGRLVDVNPAIHPGRWLPRNEQLATVVAEAGLVARGYLAEADLWRLSGGEPGEFIPDDIMLAPVPVTLASVATSAAQDIKLAYLASPHGGRIAATRDDAGLLLPVQANYPVTLTVDASAETGGKVIRGVAHMKGAPESLAAKVWRQALKVLVRESGF